MNAAYGRDAHKVQEDTWEMHLNQNGLGRGGEIQGRHLPKVTCYLSFEEQGTISHGACIAGGTVWLILQCKAC